ncbi:MAG: GWxTD domain-containing protein [Gemmatimonadota bacterium]
MIKAVVTSAILVVLTACGPNPRRGAGVPRMMSIARPLEVYHQLGFMAGPPDFPGVASLATMAGPRDSTYVLFALSLPASALRFQRDADGFIGEYRVVISFLRDSVVIKRVEHRENVRVGSFAETGRTEESIIFQDVIALTPGKYNVQVQANDGFSSRGFRGRDTLEVPAYDEQRRLAVPIVVYQAEGRAHRGARPDFIVNARNTVPYGAEVPRIYLELYHARGGQEVHLRILNERNEPVWQQQTTFAAGSDSLRYAIVDVPTGSLPLGRLWLEASTAGASAELIRSPLLITISDQWMVANFDEVLRFVNYIAHPAELDSLRTATETERLSRWDQFWQRRDPLTSTPVNEFREEFFQRVRFATEHFNESGRPGWETDRGEVYIVLGQPDQVADRFIGREVGTEANAVEWIYENAAGGQLQLLFVDRAGFGRFELSTQSEHAFRAAANRLKPRAPLPTAPPG